VSGFGPDFVGFLQQKRVPRSAAVKGTVEKAREALASILDSKKPVNEGTISVSL
jgi:hypothetical protein